MQTLIANWFTVRKKTIMQTLIANWYTVRKKTIMQTPIANYCSEEYSESCKISQMEGFAKIFSGFQPSAILAKRSISRVLNTFLPSILPIIQYIVNYLCVVTLRQENEWTLLSLFCKYKNQFLKYHPTNLILSYYVSLVEGKNPFDKSHEIIRKLSIHYAYSFKF